MTAVATAPRLGRGTHVGYALDPSSTTRPATAAPANLVAEVDALLEGAGVLDLVYRPVQSSQR